MPEFVIRGQGPGTGPIIQTDKGLVMVSSTLANHREVIVADTLSQAYAEFRTRHPLVDRPHTVGFDYTADQWAALFPKPFESGLGGYSFRDGLVPVTGLTQPTDPRFGMCQEAQQ